MERFTSSRNAFTCASVQSSQTDYGDLRDAQLLGGPLTGDGHRSRHRSCVPRQRSRQSSFERAERRESDPRMVSRQGSPTARPAPIN